MIILSLLVGMAPFIGSTILNHGVEFSEIPLEISRAIVEDWVRRRGRDYRELLELVWTEEEPGTWIGSKR